MYRSTGNLSTGNIHRHYTPLQSSHIPLAGVGLNRVEVETHSTSGPVRLRGVLRETIAGKTVASGP